MVRGKAVAALAQENRLTLSRSPREHRFHLNLDVFSFRFFRKTVTVS